MTPAFAVGAHCPGRAGRIPAAMPRCGAFLPPPSLTSPRYEVLKDLVDECIDLSLNYRQSGHPGGSRSKVHMMLALALSGAMRWDVRRPWLRFSDRFVLSAGHTVPLVYATLAVLNEGLRARYERTGLERYAFPEDGKFALTWEMLPQLRHRGGLPGHAEMAGKSLFLKFNTGPSGHGIGPAVGEALALKLAGAGEVKVFASKAREGSPRARPRGQEHCLGPRPVEPRLPRRLERLRHRPPAGVERRQRLPGGLVCPLRMEGHRRRAGLGMGAGDGRAVLEARLGPTLTASRASPGSRPAKAAGTGSTTPPATASRGPINAEQFWAVRKQFMARYGVEYEGVDGPARPAPRRCGPRRGQPAGGDGSAPP